MVKQTGPEGLIRAIFPGIPSAVICPFILEQGREILLPEALNQALNTLVGTTGTREAYRQRWKQTLELYYYGREGQEPMTAAEVAAEFEVSIGRIRVIIRDALRELRRPENSKLLKGFFVAAPQQDEALPA